MLMKSLKHMIARTSFWVLVSNILQRPPSSSLHTSYLIISWKNIVFKRKHNKVKFLISFVSCLLISNEQITRLKTTHTTRCIFLAPVRKSLPQNWDQIYFKLISIFISKWVRWIYISNTIQIRLLQELNAKFLDSKKVFFLNATNHITLLTKGTYMHKLSMHNQMKRWKNQQEMKS